ncbi:MAG: hypothetical protein DMF84_04885 [Acidobacteria bacterium]|nr:MAG: hypothetical protein DMF84_04885 [Acidobacteriota bacterium]
MCTLMLQACLSSSVALQVSPDGSGRAVVTSRLYEQALQYFETIFSVAPAERKTAEESMPPPSEAYLSSQFGTAVRLESTELEKTVDGVIRKTILTFPDITQVRVVASDIARSLQPVPGGHTIRFVQRERSADTTRLLIEELNPATGEIELLTAAVAGGDEADLAWTPDGTLLMARGDVVYAWRRGDAEWKQIAALDRLGLTRVSRIAVSPGGDRIALIGTS